MHRPPVDRRGAPGASARSLPLLALGVGVTVGLLAVPHRALRSHALAAADAPNSVWAAAPQVPVAASAPPAIANPTLLVGASAPARCSLSATIVTYRTARRTARTRWGGLYGP